MASNDSQLLKKVLTNLNHSETENKILKLEDTNKDLLWTIADLAVKNKSLETKLDELEETILKLRSEQIVKEVCNLKSFDDKMDVKLKKTYFRILSSLPDSDISNPIAGVTNWFDHQLNLKVEFTFVMHSESDWECTVKLGNIILGHSRDSKKAQSKHNAAVDGLKFLNSNMEYTEFLIINHLVKN
jgi:DNA gyrase/topoisomerase IV subunit A